MTSSGITTPTTVRQPRIQIPSTLPSLLQTELLLVDRLLRKNKPQHRSGLFYQKCTHVLRLMKRMAVVVNDVVKANESTTLTVEGIGARGLAGQGTKNTKQPSEEKDMKWLHRTLVELVEKTLPAITKASEVLEKMIIHLHFLPLTSTLLAITSRMFVITIDTASYLVQYREATQDRIPTDVSGSSTPVPGNAKEKEKDKVSFSFEDVVGMVISGKVQNSRMTTARDQLAARLQALDQQVQQDGKGKGKAVGSVVGNDRMALLEMDGEDFGEAIELVPRPTDADARLTPIGTKLPRTKTTIVLDPPSSPDEPNFPLPVLTSASTSTSNGEQTLERKKTSHAKKDATEVFASSFSPALPELVTIPDKSAVQPETDKSKQEKRSAVEETLVKKIPTKRKSSTFSVGASDKPKVKKRKGKDTMDDIFGL